MLKFPKKKKINCSFIIFFFPHSMSLVLLLSKNKINSSDCLICVCEKFNNLTRENNI